MSDTYIHKGRALWLNGMKDEGRKDIQKYLHHCRRYNSDRAYFKNIKNKLYEKAIRMDQIA